MNRKQFDEVCENWYQRTHRLRRYYENTENDCFKRLKALRLWGVMAIRVLNCSNKLIQLNAMPAYRSSEPQSGIIHKPGEKLTLPKGDNVYKSKEEFDKKLYDILIKNGIAKQ